MPPKNPLYNQQEIYSSKTQNVDVLILAGGEGKRLHSVIADRPKVLAEVAGKPFLHIIINKLISHGFRRIILSIGYLKEQIVGSINKEKGYKNIKIEFSEEKTPLGTGGALKKAASLIKSDPFLMLNGDSICPVDFEKFSSFHEAKKAFISLVLAEPREVPDYGVVTLDPTDRITSFNEKISENRNHFANGGIYLMSKDVFSHMPALDVFSLENDFFPKVIGLKCYGFVSPGRLIDIGTPERFYEAQKFNEIQKA